jgi:hypothetical protein
LCRDEDGHVRNAFFLATPDGIAGRHDKDIPTAWENCFYVGGTDDGLIELGDMTAGVVVADVKVGRVEAREPVPRGFWVQGLDALSKVGRCVQDWHGRRWYRRHVAPPRGRE